MTSDTEARHGMRRVERAHPPHAGAEIIRSLVGWDSLARTREAIALHRQLTAPLPAGWHVVVIGTRAGCGTSTMTALLAESLGNRRADPTWALKHGGGTSSDRRARAPRFDLTIIDAGVVDDVEAVLLEQADAVCVTVPAEPRAVDAALERWLDAEGTGPIGAWTHRAITVVNGGPRFPRHRELEVAASRARRRGMPVHHLHRDAGMPATGLPRLGALHPRTKLSVHRLAAALVAIPPARGDARSAANRGAEDACGTLDQSTSDWSLGGLS